MLTSVQTSLIWKEKLTDVKSGLSSMTLVRSGRADFDFPIARNTVALL